MSWVATITVVPGTDNTGDASAQVQKAVDSAKLPASATVSLGGVTSQQNSSFQQLGLALLAAIMHGGDHDGHFGLADIAALRGELSATEDIERAGAAVAHNHLRGGIAGALVAGGGGVPGEVNALGLGQAREHAGGEQRVAGGRHSLLFHQNPHALKLWKAMDSAGKGLGLVAHMRLCRDGRYPPLSACPSEQWPSAGDRP